VVDTGLAVFPSIADPLKSASIAAKVAANIPTGPAIDRRRRQNFPISAAKAGVPIKAMAAIAKPAYSSQPMGPITS
jgi:hypothetical protein